MTIHGDLYYEGKEFETRLKNKKPGELSDELRVALGMPTGLVRKHDVKRMYMCVYVRGNYNTFEFSFQCVRA